MKHIKEKNLYQKKGKTTTTAKKPKAVPRAWAEGVIKPKDTKPEDAKPEEGSGRRRTKRPRKTKEGGSSGGILINEVVNARVKGDVVPEPRVDGGIPSMKVPKARAKKMLTNKYKYNIILYI